MITVLLVHDNTELIDATRSYLEKMGEVRVDAVQSTKQALEILKSRNYDVLVSYYHLPEVNGIEFFSDMNGVELLKYLKMRGHSLPFIMYTRTNGSLVLEDVNNATEVQFPRGVEPGNPVTEFREMILQAVMRKKAERDLAARCDMLTSILEATPLWVFQVHGQVMDWVNSTMTAALGYEEGILAGKSILSLFPTADECDHAIREMKIRVGEDGWGHSDSVMKCKSGALIPVRIRMRKNRADPAGGMILVCEDMTRIRQMEESLKESELRNREMIHNSTSLIMKLDTEGTITFFNKYSQSFFGYSAPEIIGKNIIGTIISPGSGKSREIASFVNDVALNGEGQSLRIFEMTLRDSEPAWVAWTNKAIRDETGHITEIVCIGHDITDHDSRDHRRRISTTMWKDRVIADTDVTGDVFDAVFNISMEIAKEGREGKQLGTAFIIGDSQDVLTKSKQLILNPFEGHRTEDRMITNHDIKENVKELAQLDGAFIIRGDGLIEAAARYITIDTSSVGIPKGLGTRHSSVAGITMVTSAIGIVVSQSGGKISIFRNGRMVQEIS